jgi:cardiolipin synthase
MRFSRGSGSLSCTVLDIVVSVASVHVILFKRDTKSAIGWIGLIWLSPILGTVVYVFLGINRINRRLIRPGAAVSGPLPGSAPRHPRPDPVVRGSPLDSLVQLGDRVTMAASCRERVWILDGGDQAYPP